MLDWLLRRKGSLRAHAAPRLAPLLSLEEIELWRRLEAEVPTGHRILPLVPLVFFVQGNLPEAVKREVVPYLQVDRAGYPYRAFLYQGSPIGEFLDLLGLPWEVVSQAPPPPPPSQGSSYTPAPRPPTPEPAVPPAASEMAEAVEPAEALQSQESEPQEPPPAEPAESSITRDLASAFWRGELHALVLTNLIQPPKDRDKGKTSPDQAEEASDRRAEAAPEGPAVQPLPEVPPPEPPTSPVPPHTPAPAEEEDPSIPPTCPLCGAPMVLRVARRGGGAGREFWGCSRYPTCKGTRPKKSV